MIRYNISINIYIIDVMLNLIKFCMTNNTYKVVWIKIEIMGEIILNRGNIFGNLMPNDCLGFWNPFGSPDSWLQTKKSCS